MYSEEELGYKFQKFLKDSSTQQLTVPNFNLIFKEVQSIQGIPDYVGLYFNIPNNVEVLKNILKIEIDSINNISRILPYINKKSPHNIDYLSKKTNLSITSVTSVIKKLKDEKIIDEIEDKKYVLSMDLEISKIEIWSFELKLKNWKRAIFQSLRYKLFSDYVYIVMPSNMEAIIKKNVSRFKEYNIGVILYDETANNFKRVIRANKNIKSKSHTFYILLQLLVKVKNGDRVRNK